MLLRFRPEDGMHVLVRGKATVYEQRGQLQLVGESIEPVGAGSLQLAFEQLRERLRKEGLFDQDRKQLLPAFPRTVAIVTSPTGAVIRDFLNIVGRRHAGLNVVLIPAAVQGDGAAAEIEAAIALANDRAQPATEKDGSDPDQAIDLIVLARGGGSLEDMAAFNSERVARAIAGSKLAVVSAIGHETDFTIADFVADLRAPTPSAAAELVTEAQHKIADYLGTQEHRLDRAIRFQLLHVGQRLSRLQVSRTEARVSTLIHRKAQRLDDLSNRLQTALGAQSRLRQNQLAALTTTVLRHDPRQALAQARERLNADRNHLHRALEQLLHSHVNALNSLQARLHSLSPLAVLDRGYALVLTTDGGVVRSAAQLAAGDALVTRLADGNFTSRVESAALTNPGARTTIKN